MSDLGLHAAAVAATDDAARAGRDEADWAAARDPAQARAAFAAVLDMPPSEERTAALQEVFRRGYATFTRRDWELNTSGFHPTEYVFEAGDESQLLVDLPERLLGVESYIRGMLRWRSAWAEISLHSDGVADAGPGRILSWATFRLRGPGSGMALEQTTAVLYEVRDGWVINQRYWWDRNVGTRAAGVDPAAVVLAS